MGRVFVVAGIAAPWVLGGAWAWLQSRVGNLPPDGPGGAFVALLLLGCCTGALLRSWWAIPYPPAVIAALWVFTGAVYGRNGSFDGGPYTVDAAVMELLFLALAAVPYALGALLGVFAGQGVETALEDRR